MVLVSRHRFRVAFDAIKAAAAESRNCASVLLLVAPDVDALCAARILMVSSRDKERSKGGGGRGGGEGGGGGGERGEW